LGNGEIFGGLKDLKKAEAEQETGERNKEERENKKETRFGEPGFGQKI
jgi:hypothetical protein